jgi:gas vesicle protein
MREPEEKNNFFAGLIWGIILGAGGDWFLTKTEQGKIIREKLKEKSKDALGELDEIADSLREKKQELAEKVKEIQEEIEEKVATSVRPAKKKKPEHRRFFRRNGKKLS